MFMTGPRSRHQRRRARDATDFYECMMIHSRIESPSVPVQGMHMKVLVRYIVTGCIFCVASGLRQGQVFDPPAAPPVQMKVECPPPPPGDQVAVDHVAIYRWNFSYIDVCLLKLDHLSFTIVLFSFFFSQDIHHFNSPRRSGYHVTSRTTRSPSPRPFRCTASTTPPSITVARRAATPTSPSNCPSWFRSFWSRSNRNVSAYEGWEITYSMSAGHRWDSIVVSIRTLVLRSRGGPLSTTAIIYRTVRWPKFSTLTFKTVWLNSNSIFTIYLTFL